MKLFADMVPMGRVAQTDEIKGLAAVGVAGRKLPDRHLHPDRRRRHGCDDPRIYSPPCRAMGRMPDRVRQTKSGNAMAKEKKAKARRRIGVEIPVGGRKLSM